jgi:membrane protease YdiL (CAAX protease family)
MPATSGFQVAILIFAFQFFAMLATRFAAARLDWPREWYEFLGQVIVFGLAVAVLLVVAPLRRFCLDELRRPLPQGSGREVAGVALAKLAIPFGVAGAIVLGAFAAGEPATLPAKLLSTDPARAWERTFTAEGVVNMVILTWFVGPIVEELVFRGFLYRAWERQWGWIPSLFLTSACFGLFHPHHIVSSFLGSVVYVCVLRRTGTLRASILVHVAFNVLISWPLLGQVLLTLEGREISRMSTWGVELASLVFVSIALPAYLVMSRHDAREAAPR